MFQPGMDYFFGLFFEQADELFIELVIVAGKFGFAAQRGIGLENLAGAKGRIGPSHDHIQYAPFGSCNALQEF